MTEEADKVTTEKPKNPGRQEWGRKLGKMQKELKLKKQEKDEKVETPPSQSKSFFKWEYVVPVFTIGIGVLALYYQKKSYESQIHLQNSSIPDKVKTIRQEKKTQFSDF